MGNRNVDPNVVSGFGDEWSAYDQQRLDPVELGRMFDAYFSIFPWNELPPAARGFDMGCGSGRWAKLVAPRVGDLLCVDPSEKAIAVARRNLAAAPNCRFLVADAESFAAFQDSFDFGYSLGVLHHAPDPGAALRSCVERLKPGAPFLAYLYFAFDNMPAWYRGLWRVSDAVRRLVSRFPFRIRLAVSVTIASLVYWPLARMAAVAARAGFDVRRFPLSIYRSSSFYTMRTDSLDRFGTLIEHRFTRAQVQDMMQAAGLADIRFNEERPHWIAVGRRKPPPRAP
jgi:SAM-dependent methyltransferase